MKNKVLALFFCIVLLLGIIESPPLLAMEELPSGETAKLIDQCISGCAQADQCDSAQAWLDQSLAAGAGITADWFVLALRRYQPSLDFSAYTDALERYLSAQSIASPVVRQRYALLLLLCGRPQNALIADALENSIGKQGVMSWIFGLHLLRLTSPENHRLDDARTALLSLRLPDGGWAISGHISDVDVTAMALQALAPDIDRPEVSNAVDAALELLSQRQTERGGFRSYGAENPESTAQVLLALTALQIHPTQDPRFVKNGHSLLEAIRSFRLEDGSYCHEKNGPYDRSASAQVLCALIGLWRYENGLTSFYEAVGEISPEPKAPEESLPSENPASSAISSDHESAFSGLPRKIWIAFGIAAVSAAIHLILWTRQKRRLSHHLPVLMIALFAICLLFLINRTSANPWNDRNSSTASLAQTITVTLTIRCDAALGKTDSHDLPENGMILPTTTFSLQDGQTVLDLLRKAAEEYQIPLKTEGGFLWSQSTVYVSGILHLREFDCGPLSGWIFRVNNQVPTVSCGTYRLTSGDAVEWIYTCDLGKDITK